MSSYSINARYPASAQTMPESADNPLMASFWEHLLDRVDPQHTLPPEDQAMRVVAGRWLAVQRLRQHLAVEHMVAQTGLAAPTLLLLETGLANPTMIAPVERQLLISALTDAPARRTVVATVLAYALGEDVPPPAALAAMRAEIERHNEAGGGKREAENGRR